ncbi:MAG TPA: hypothetical protein VMV10_25830 [Pirellulales bacterium]|nr:hypothetical protein [Pirellulales bacterium]
MASLNRENNGWRLQIVLPDRSRKSLRLGSISKRDAERFKDSVERIVGCIKLANQLDPETAAWAAKLPDPTYAKLVSLGLLAPRQKPEATTLAAFVDAYIEGRRGTSARRTVTFWQLLRTCDTSCRCRNPLRIRSLPSRTREFWRISGERGC